MIVTDGEVSIETDDNDFQGVLGPFGIERIGDMFQLLWSLDAAGTCHHRSLTDDMKHQVALNAYEPDVFSFAGFWGPVPPVKNEKF